MSNREIGTIAKVLIDAKKRIEDPKNWCRFNYGFEGGPMCARGAILRGTHCHSRAAIMELDASAKALFGTPFSYDVNDNETLGHAAVMQMYDHAIARTLNEGK